MSFTDLAQKTLIDHQYKLTVQRKAVIDILASTKKPLNPYEISERTKGKLDVVTIYRNLELLEKLWLIHKIRSVDGYIPCHHANTSSLSKEDWGGFHHCHHYAVCTDCHKVTELHEHNHHHQLPPNFMTENQVYELTGKCEKCK